MIKGQGLAKLMDETGVTDVDINFLDISTVAEEDHQKLDVSKDFLASPWYKDVVYVLKNCKLLQS